MDLSPTWNSRLTKNADGELFIITTTLSSCSDDMVLRRIYTSISFDQNNNVHTHADPDLFQAVPL